MMMKWTKERGFRREVELYMESICSIKGNWVIIMVKESRWNDLILSLGNRLWFKSLNSCVFGFGSVNLLLYAS